MPTIQILCFRGTGGFGRGKYKQLPGLIKAGHVGVRFEGDPIIYGFHPSPKAEEEAGGEEELLNLLFKNIAQEGTWQNDTAIFVQAHNLSKQGKRTEVWVLSQEVDEEEFHKIYQGSLSWYNGSKVSRYNLPKRDGTFAAGEYNCAVFPQVLGIKIPLEDGRVSEYIDKMKQLGATIWQL